MSLRPDLAIIADHVVPGARVLDIGCGDGALMAALRDGRRVDARGLEIASANVSAAIARGLSGVEGDADVEPWGFPDQRFAFALSHPASQLTATTPPTQGQ